MNCVKYGPVVVGIQGVINSQGQFLGIHVGLLRLVTEKSPRPARSMCIMTLLGLVTKDLEKKQGFAAGMHAYRTKKFLCGLSAVFTERLRS